MCVCVCALECTLKNAFQKVRGLTGVLKIFYYPATAQVLCFCFIGVTVINTSKTNTCQTSSVNTVALA